MIRRARGDLDGSAGSYLETYPFHQDRREVNRRAMSFPAISRPVRIFYSYAVTARKDKNLFSKLKSHLATLRHQKLIDDSYDSESVVRGDIEHDIDISIKNANIIILL